MDVSADDSPLSELPSDTVPDAVAVGRAASPQRQTFCIKSIPQSAKLLLHLSGSHLATHKLHYSFLLYAASSSCFFSVLDEGFCFQMLKVSSTFFLITQFHVFVFFGGQICHSQLPSASGLLIGH